MPSATRVITRFERPYETSGSAKPVVGTQFTGGGNADLAMLCWEHGDLNNGNSLVMRQRFDSFRGGAIVTTATRIRRTCAPKAF